ncbi:hypothetical protein DEJ46_28050 [Streptomyces venezuelae]|uniref:Uncharacterized protein n=1 Tax=Streptomyces venezuelae TaxID=54571 RepID=A0A5P2AXH8_STRVZ|nr:hypothetical protein DEJ46_28050 [Streptomyces venezuelae]
MEGGGGQPPPGCGRAFRRAMGVPPARAKPRAWGRVGTTHPPGRTRRQRRGVTGGPRLPDGPQPRGTARPSPERRAPT